MARFFVWSAHGDVIFLARRLVQEGHEVLVYTQDRTARWVGDGLVPRTRSPIVPHGWTVLFDCVEKGGIGQQLRARGHPVIGGNPFDRALEVDRTKGTAIMRQHGIATPRTETFTRLEDGVAFLADQDGTWFFKPSGNQATGFTMHGTPDMLARYMVWAYPQLEGRPAFELQAQTTGTEVSCEGWFDGRRFVPPFNSTFEDKKFLTGDLGGRAGCAANVVWRWNNPALPERVLAPLVATLQAARYVGPLDLNMIVTEDGVPTGLEWSARTGFDALQAFSLLIEGDVGVQLDAFARGSLDHFAVRDDLALTLRISKPPYPMAEEGAPKERGLPLDPRLLTHPRVLLDDVMVGRDGLPICAGRDGSLACIGAVGDDMELLRERVLAVAESFEIPSVQYRTDPVARAERDWQALDEVGLGREVPGGTGEQAQA